MEQRLSLFCLCVCIDILFAFLSFFYPNFLYIVWLFSLAVFSLTLLSDAAHLPPFHLPLLPSVLVNGELQTQIPWAAVSDMMDNWAVTL